MFNNVAKSEANTANWYNRPVWQLNQFNSRGIDVEVSGDALAIIKECHSINDKQLENVIINERIEKAQAA